MKIIIKNQIETRYALNARHPVQQFISQLNGCKNRLFHHYSKQIRSLYTFLVLVIKEWNYKTTRHLFQILGWSCIKIPGGDYNVLHL